LLRPAGAPPPPLPHLSAFLRKPAGAGRADEAEGEGAAGLPAPAPGVHPPVQREGHFLSSAEPHAGRAPPPLTLRSPVQEELVELVLGQQSSPSDESAPETPIPSSVTSDPPDLAPRISSVTPDSPEPPAAQPEAPPTEPGPPEPDAQDEDQVRPARRGRLGPGLVLSLDRGLGSGLDSVSSSGSELGPGGGPALGAPGLADGPEPPGGRGGAQRAAAQGNPGQELRELQRLL